MPRQSHFSHNLAFVDFQCMRTKFNMVSLLESEYKFNTLCICEHWLSDLDIELYSNVNNLWLATQFCRSQHKSGGVAIYLKYAEDYEVLSLDELSSEINIE